jgi:hypothetical protein
LDAAEPPRIVFEDTAKCSDSDSAAVALRLSLGAPHEATTGWTIALKIERRGVRAVRAAGTITDARGATVASRMLFGTGPDCAALAQAMSVWASLVLEAEGKRPHTAAAETQPPSAPVAKPEPEASASASEPSTAPWPAPEPAETPSPEHDWYLHHDTTPRSLEFGMSGFLMTGTGGGAMVGPSPFLYIEAGHGIFLRPSLAFGQTLTSWPGNNGNISGTWLGTRFDTCARLPGLYPTRSGMQVDLCGGADFALTLLDAGQTLGFIAVGPSLDLRGELGNNLAVALRGVVGVNLLQPGFVDQNGTPETVPGWSGRGELALSWSLR